MNTHNFIYTLIINIYNNSFNFFISLKIIPYNRNSNKLLINNIIYNI